MKKRRRKQKFDKQMQKKLLGVFAFVLLVLVILNLRIAYINIKSGDKYAKQVLSQKEYDSQTHSLPAGRDPGPERECTWPEAKRFTP